jgi:hypothetical protein
MLEVDGAAGSSAAPAGRSSKGRANRLLTDTDGIGVRVERGRQGSISFKDKNRQFPGFFVKKRFPLGGGWNNYEGGYLYCFFGV